MYKIRIISASIAILLTSLIFLPSSTASPRTIKRDVRNLRLARQILYPVLKARDIIHSSSSDIILSDKTISLSIDLDGVDNYLQLDQSSYTYINCHNSNWDLKIEISLYSKSNPPVQRTITVQNASLKELTIRTNNHNDTVIIDVDFGVELIKVNLCGGRDYLDGTNSRVALWITADNVVDVLPDYITTGSNDDRVEIITDYQRGLRIGYFVGYVYTYLGNDRIVANRLGEGVTLRGGVGYDTIFAEDGFDTYIDAENIVDFIE